MRTTIDLPDNLMKAAKVKALEQGVSLKSFFTRALKNELDKENSASSKPWKKLQNMGSTKGLSAQSSGFEGYAGPDWNTGFHVNEDLDQ